MTRNDPAFSRAVDTEAVRHALQTIESAVARGPMAMRPTNASDAKRYARLAHCAGLAALAAVAIAEPDGWTVTRTNDRKRWHVLYNAQREMVWRPVPALSFRTMREGMEAVHSVADVTRWRQTRVGVLGDRG